MLFVTFAFSTPVCFVFAVSRIKVAGEARGEIFLFALMAQLAFPLQGFFNFLVYVRPSTFLFTFAQSTIACER
jgi:hypothetical protein